MASRYDEMDRMRGDRDRFGNQGYSGSQGRHDRGLNQQGGPFNNRNEEEFRGGYGNYSNQYDRGDLDNENRGYGNQGGYRGGQHGQGSYGHQGGYGNQQNYGSRRGHRNQGVDTERGGIGSQGSFRPQGSIGRTGSFSPRGSLGSMGDYGNYGASSSGIVGTSAGGNMAGVETGSMGSSFGGGMGSHGRHAGRGPEGYQRSDERIREEIDERLTHHGDMDATEIDVQVQSGEVTLTGTVADRQAKRLAEDIAGRGFTA